MIIMAICPTCAAKVIIEQMPHLNQRFVCPGCADVLEIVRLNPLQLNWVFEDRQHYLDDDDYPISKISIGRRMR